MAGRSTQSRTDFDDKGLLFLNSQCLRAMGSQLVFTAMTKSSIICISVHSVWLLRSDYKFATVGKLQPISAHITWDWITV